jgi:predicted protein tyrosine phosphatase
MRSPGLLPLCALACALALAAAECSDVGGLAWLCSAEDARRPLPHRVRAVVCAADCHDVYRGPAEQLGVADVLRAEIDDAPSADIAAHFDRAASFAAKYARGAAAFHCRQGVSRSAALLVAFLMREHSMKLVEALCFVRKHRPQAHPNHGFVGRLADYAARLEGAREAIPLGAAYAPPAANPVIPDPPDASRGISLTAVGGAPPPTDPRVLAAEARQLALFARERALWVVRVIKCMESGLPASKAAGSVADFVSTWGGNATAWRALCGQRERMESERPLRDPHLNLLDYTRDTMVELLGCMALADPTPSTEPER